MNKVSDADFDLALKAYFSAVEHDYMSIAPGSKYYSQSNFHLVKSTGRKYLRISAHSWGFNSAHSFIVLKDCVVRGDNGPLTLRRGDILKAAAYHQPALNFVRGNILDLDYSKCVWTGAA